MGTQPKIGCFFLDSGAHSFYKRAVPKSNYSQIQQSRDPVLYAAYGRFKGDQFVMTPAFQEYVDAYARFVIEHEQHLDHYATVDAIYNPEISYAVFKYLQDEHDLRPVPVIHAGTELHWIERYLSEGEAYLGLGGLGQGSTKSNYYRWADSVFDLLCPESNNRRPLVKTHGFAMTSHELLLRYPWYSVDSTSWVKVAAFGSLLVPTPLKVGSIDYVKSKGVHTAWNYAERPLNVTISGKVKDNSRRELTTAEQQRIGYHWRNLSPALKTLVEMWLAYCEIPLGSFKQDGTQAETGAIWDDDCRKGANLIYYENLLQWIGPYPKQYVPENKQGLRKGLGF
jgi:hypothetical protein